MSFETCPAAGNLAVPGLRSGPVNWPNIVGESPVMRHVYQIIEKVAPGDANVAIEGKTGTGKELVAQAVHRAGPRRDRPFVALDCAGIPEGLIESQLFGHVRGAFTGAVSTRPGMFAEAHRGTLFIDEIAELSRSVQIKLLRVVQTREFAMVGDTKRQRVDVRIITATNRNLWQAVVRGDFREDLYYRIAVVHLRLPPLRDRKEDIPLLIDHFLRLMTREYRKEIRGVTPAALEALMAYAWPGNVRQLENWIEQAVVLADGDMIDVGHLPTDKISLSGPPPAPENLTLPELERWYVLEILRRTKGNQTKAAKLLGISLRGLQYKLKRYVDGCDDVEAIDRLRGRNNGRAAAPRRLLESRAPVC